MTQAYLSLKGWCGSERSAELEGIKIDVAGIVAAREAPSSWKIHRRQRTARISCFKTEKFLK